MAADNHNLQTTPISHFLSLIRHIRIRNYKLSYSLHINLNIATFIFLIQQLQILSIQGITLSDSDSNISEISTIVSFVKFTKIFIFLFPVSEDVQSIIGLYAIVFLCLMQGLCFVLAVSPISTENKELCAIFSKIITFVCLLTPIPHTLILVRKFMESQSTLKWYISVAFLFVFYLVMILNQLIYSHFHFCFSVKNISKNILCRFPKNNLRHFGWMGFALIYYFCKSYSYPTLYVVFLFCVFFFSLFETKNFVVGLQYLDNKLNRNLGILSLLNVTFALTSISYFLGFALFKNSLVAFSTTFYLFSVNFLLTFNKFWIKRITIDDNTTTQITQITYVTTFLMFFCQISNKKYQTYISSLLKNHSNNCTQVQCCCKNRGTIFDPSTKLFGSPSLQPHLDPVFIKHFYLKMIKDSIIQFPKSVNIKFLLALFYLQFMELAPECIKQIKYLNRKFIKDKLSIQQKHALFCIQQQFVKLVQRHNLVRGDKAVEKANQFDEHMDEILKTISHITQNYQSFWKILNNSHTKNKNNEEQKQINQNILNSVAFRTLFHVKNVEIIYEQMKKINPVSNQLTDLMFYYSKQIVCDMDLFVKLKDDIKMQKYNRKQIQKQNKRFIKLYSPQSANIVISENNKILWVSNNTKYIFGYTKNSELNSETINNLMPPFFASNHDALVKQWLVTGKCQKMNNASKIWCRQKSGACFRAIIYMKIMIVQTASYQKDLKYYVCIQKLNKNQIVCGEDGEIYACDENVQQIFGCSMKTIQNFRPNIQIFFPSLFSHFMKYFYQQSTITKKFKQVQSIAGYIPNTISKFVEQFSKQKAKFLFKHKNNKNIHSAYALYIELKMQEITMQIKGMYLSLQLQVQKIEALNRKLVVFKIVGSIKINTIEKFYSQFEVILKILSLNKEKIGAVGKLDSLNKKTKNYVSYSGAMQLFYSPKKLRRASGNGLKKAQSINKIYTIEGRKKRAYHQLFQFKNPRVRRNILKIKKCLLENKIFSPHTYRLLTEQKMSDHGIRDNHLDKIDQSSQISQKISMKLKSIQQSFLDSDDEFLEQIHQSSYQQKSGNKIQGSKSYRNQSNSSAFLAMSTKVRILKNQLKSVRGSTMLKLFVFLLLLLVLLINILNISEYFVYSSRTESRLSKSKHLLKTYFLSQSLMSLKLILPLNSSTVVSISTLEQKLLSIANGYLLSDLSTPSSISSSSTESSSQQKTPTFLNTYLQNTSLTVSQFLLKEYIMLAQNTSSGLYEEYQKVIEWVEKQNYSVRQDMQHSWSISYMIIGILGINLGIIFVLSQARNKLKQIIQLLYQVYPNQKQKQLSNSHKIHRHILKTLSSRNITNRHLSSRSPPSSSPTSSIYPSLILLFCCLYLPILADLSLKSFTWSSTIQKYYKIDQITQLKMEISYQVLSYLNGIQLSDQSTRQLVPLLIQMYNAGDQNYLNQDVLQGIQGVALGSYCDQLSTGICTSNNTYNESVIQLYSYVLDTLSSTNKTVNITQQLYLMSAVSAISTFPLVNLFFIQQNCLQQHLLFILLVLLLIFAAATIFLLIIGFRFQVYYKVAERLSMYNSHLLMLPFQLLVQNPYIRQYLKGEFKITL